MSNILKMTVRYGQVREPSTLATAGNTPLRGTVPAMSHDARQEWQRLAASLKNVTPLSGSDRMA